MRSQISRLWRMRNFLHVGKDLGRWLQHAPITDLTILVSYFYEGMSPLMKQLLETMCGGDFMNKNPDEAFQFLDYVARYLEVGKNQSSRNHLEIEQ
ncbi:hypothetical protein CK203_054779 [Vitis vinifera]|uniref:Uncharacterized protein n=1 Tax=Vitis vinifera TaxID=29760 RepID=A0A438GIS2_VITVI|nr:hypothetical protein CK203_054779 [Vitis vinifera]